MALSVRAGAMSHRPAIGSTPQSRTLRKQPTDAEKAMWRMHREERDAMRTRLIEAEGYELLRFWNQDVIHNRDGVYSVIAAALGRHPHPTSPIKGEEQK